MIPKSDVWTLTARWVVPVDGPPLENGTVTIKGDHFLNPQPHSARKADIDLGNCAILPGFVNAHTHLDLSGMRGKCPPTPDFTRWLRGVIAHRRGQTSIDHYNDVLHGADQCIQFGTTLVGDISAEGNSWQHYQATPFRSVVFYEVIGLTQQRAWESSQSLHAWRKSFVSTQQLRPGLSPHAPYSVRLSLL